MSGRRLLPGALQGAGEGLAKRSCQRFWPRHAVCDFMLPLFRRHQPVTISHLFDIRAAFVRGPRELHMIGLVRAITVCAMLVLDLVSAQAADKAFRRDDLADAAIKLEAQIKSEAGPVSKSAATLRNDADAAFRRNDFRSGLQILGQIVATTPDDSGNWLKLARTIFQIKPSNTSEQTFFLERASTAAYLAYQRAANPQDEADALGGLGRAFSYRKLWRPALDALRMSLDLREVADVRGQYEKLRNEFGFRLLG